MENNTHVSPLPFETGFEMPDDDIMQVDIISEFDADMTIAKINEIDEELDSIDKIVKKEIHYGEFQEAENASLKAFEVSPVDPELGDFYIGLCLAYLGQEKYGEALDAADKMIQHYPDSGSILGIRAAILGHLKREQEGEIALERYLSLRPNLKTRDDYRKSFLPNSILADTIIEGLIKAGWSPAE